MVRPQLLAVALTAAVWLCPLWLTPTAIVPSLLWGAVALGGLLLIDAVKNSRAFSLQKLFLGLLLSLGCMMAWRSHNAPNTLAALLCLVCIGLAATLSAKAHVIRPASVMAWGFLLGGIVNAAWGLVQYFGWTAEPLGMAFGFLRQRNNFATLCNIALIAMLYLWHQNKLNPKLAVAAGLLLAAALAATTSRAGLLGFISIALAIGLQSRLRKAAVLLIAAYGLLAWTLPQIIHSQETIVARVSSTASDGKFQDSRSILWSNTLAVIEKNLLLGVGWRELDLALHLADFGTSERFPGQVDNAHNLPLQFAAELGIPFTAAWLIALTWLVLRNKPWLARSPEQLLGWGVLFVIGIHSLLEYPLWYAPFQITTGLAAGLVFSVSSSHPSPRTSHIWQGLAGIALLIFAAYAAFDYHRVRQLFISDSERSERYRSHTLAQAESSWLFAAQVRYAKLSITPVTTENAPQVVALAQEVLHFSPEPWVFEKLTAARSLLAPLQ